MNKILSFIKMFATPDLKNRLTDLKSYDNEPKNFVLIFDIDYCLYQSEPCYKAELDHITKMENALQSEWYDSEFPKDSPYPKTIKELKKEFGSTAEGIKAFYKKDIEYFIRQGFHDAYLYIKKDEELIRKLKNLPFKKYCMTNGFQIRAEPIIKKLELEDCFDGIFCPDENHPTHPIIAKPMVEAYRFVEQNLKLDKNTRIVFFDDVKENLEIAISDEFQWITYHVTPENDIHSRLKEFEKKYLKRD